jgi:hypothetical protein
VGLAPLNQHSIVKSPVPNAQSSLSGIDKYAEVPLNTPEYPHLNCVAVLEKVTLLLVTVLPVAESVTLLSKCSKSLV